MGKVLVIAEHLDGRLNASTAKTVSAAVAYKPNKALIRQARPRWIAMLRRLIKTLEEA